MTDKINELLRRVEEFKPKAAAEIEEFRIRILGKKGELTALMEEFKTVAPEPVSYTHLTLPTKLEV